MKLYKIMRKCIDGSINHDPLDLFYCPFEKWQALTILPKCSTDPRWVNYVEETTIDQWRDDLYMLFLNDFSTVARFAEWYCIPVQQADDLLKWCRQ